MSIETDFRAVLAGYPPLTALVGERIALNAIPEGSAAPLVVFAATHQRTLGLDGGLLADLCSLQVQCWGHTSAQADQVADAVIAAVATAPSAACAVVLTMDSTFDEELGLDGVMLSVEWWDD